MSNSKQPANEPENDPQRRVSAGEETQPDESLLDQLISETSRQQDAPPLPTRRTRIRSFLLLGAIPLIAAAAAVLYFLGQHKPLKLPLVVSPQHTVSSFQLQSGRQALAAPIPPLLAPEPTALTAYRPTTAPRITALQQELETAMLAGQTATGDVLPDVSTDIQPLDQSARRPLGPMGQPVLLPRLTLPIQPQRTSSLQPKIDMASAAGEAISSTSQPTGERSPSVEQPRSARLEPKLALLQSPPTSEPFLPPDTTPHVQTMEGEATPAIPALTAPRAQFTLEPYAHMQNAPVGIAAEPMRLPPPTRSRERVRVPPKPVGVEDYIVELVNRAVLPLSHAHADAPARLLVENLRYRDKEIESEGTKLLSGLVNRVVEQQSRLKGLSPEELMQQPDGLLRGEVWDLQNAIRVHLRLIDSKSGQELSRTESRIPIRWFAREIAFKPPESKSLTIIQKMIALLDQFFPDGGDFRVVVWPDKGKEALYIEGDKLIVQILAEESAYLQVDYYQTDGKVVHLLPNDRDPNFAERGKVFTIGTPQDRYEFVVKPPFGEELLTVIASQQPLEKLLTTEMIESATSYLKRLTQYLQALQAQGKVASARSIILTKQR